MRKKPKIVLCVLVLLLMALSTATAIVQPGKTDDVEMKVGINAVPDHHFGGGPKDPADLRLTTIFTGPSPPIAGQSATIFILIDNVGDKDVTDPFYSHLYIDGSYSASKYITELAGGEQAVFSKAVTLGVGNHVLRAVADVYDYVDEPDETNNEMTRTIEWVVLPDLAAVDIWTSPDSPLGGQSATIYYRISTNSVPFTETVKTALYIDGALKVTRSLVGSSGSATYTYTYSTTLAAWNHVIKMVTDSDGVLSESSESNNERTETIYWRGPPDRWAVIVEGGFIAGDAETQAAFGNEVCRAYNTLLSAGFTSSSIYFMSQVSRDANGDSINDVDDTSASYSEVKDVISSSTGWLRTRCSQDDIVFFYFADHGRDPDGHFLLKYSTDEWITDEEMGTWLDTITCYQMTFVIDACFSGNFIDDCAGSQRIIITSTDADTPGWAMNPDGIINNGDEYMVFSYHFFEYLPGWSIESAFAHADAEVAAWCLTSGEEQYPLMSDCNPSENWYL